LINNIHSEIWKKNAILQLGERKNDGEYAADLFKIFFACVNDKKHSNISRKYLDKTQAIC